MIAQLLEDDENARLAENLQNKYYQGDSSRPGTAQ